jgi:hypothetical protein
VSGRLQKEWITDSVTSGGEDVAADASSVDPYHVFVGTPGKIPSTASTTTIIMEIFPGDDFIGRQMTSCADTPIS